MNSDPTVPTLSTVVLNIDLAGTILSPTPLPVQTGKISGTINITTNGVSYTSVGTWICEVDSKTQQQIKETCQANWIKDVGTATPSTADITGLPYVFDGLSLTKKYEVAVGVYDFSNNQSKSVGSSNPAIDCPNTTSTGYTQLDSNYCPVPVGDVQNFNITLSDTAVGIAENARPPGLSNDEFALKIDCFVNGTCSALDVSKWISEIACHVPGLQQQTCDPTRGECQMLTVPPCLYQNVNP